MWTTHIGSIGSLPASCATSIARAFDPRAVAAVSPSGDDTVEHVALSPLGEGDLRAIFTGHERVTHIRSAPRGRCARTLGVLASVVEECGAWERAGLAQFEGDHLSVDIAAVDRLEADGRGRLSRCRLARPRRSGSRHRETDLLWTAAFAWPQTHTPTLAALMNLARWELEAAVVDLVERNLLRALPDGRLEPLATPPEAWPEERRVVGLRLRELLRRAGPTGG